MYVEIALARMGLTSMASIFLHLAMFSCWTAQRRPDTPPAAFKCFQFKLRGWHSLSCTQHHMKYLDHCTLGASCAMVGKTDGQTDRWAASDGGATRRLHGHTDEQIDKQREGNYNKRAQC